MKNEFPFGVCLNCGKSEADHPTAQYLCAVNSSLREEQHRRRKDVTPERIKEMLESNFFPPDITPNTVYRREHDDCVRGDGEDLIVASDVMGDMYISIKGNKQLRFRTRGGGGESLRVRNALIILAEAIRLDNISKQP